MLTPLLIYALVVLAILAAFFAILLVNLAVLPTLGDARRRRTDDRRPTTDDRTGQPPAANRQPATRNPHSGQLPKVAVLVPARNEEANIEASLRSLLAQDYPDLEVWLYDDASTDGTADIAARVQTEHQSRLHIVRGTEEPPAGWLGKPHACQRLYEAMRAQSDPDYVLFTDADVRFEPPAVSLAVALAEERKVGLLSIFPRQEMMTWAERLAVPILSHCTVYTFLPLPLAFTPRAGPAFSAANGQFMLFTREAYEATGDHAAVRSRVLEDVALAQAVKRAGYHTLLADCGPLIHTRMYKSAGEVWRGYSKNLYAFFGYSPLFMGVAFAGLAALYVAPLPLAAVFLPSLAGFVFLAQYLVALASRLALSIRFKDPLTDALIQPIAILYVFAIGINSMVWAITGKGAWKGRSVRT